MTRKIQRNGGVVLDGSPLGQVVADVAAYQNRLGMVGFTAITNSLGGGTADDEIVFIPPTFANAANADTNLAQKASAEALADVIMDNFASIATHMNLIAVQIGLPVMDLDALDAASFSANTLAAQGVAVTAATTGIPALNANALFTAINTNFARVTTFFNTLAVALGEDKVPLNAAFVAAYPNPAGDPVAVPVSLGTAADPGVTKAAFDAALVTARHNFATLVAYVATLKTANPAALVAVV